jgi:hypothetical protein
MLYIKDAIRVEKYYPPGGNGGRKNVYIFECIECDNEIKLKARSRLTTATGLCVKCNNKRMHPAALKARRLRPFEAMYHKIHDSAKERKKTIELTYEQFLLKTKINNCHYCNEKVFWNKYGQSCYNLDRKDNDEGYSDENTVVCCYKCNKGKREIYSYDDWYGMTAYFRDK